MHDREHPFMITDGEAFPFHSWIHSLWERWCTNYYERNYKTKTITISPSCMIGNTHSWSLMVKRSLSTAGYIVSERGSAHLRLIQTKSSSLEFSNWSDKHFIFIFTAVDYKIVQSILRWNKESTNGPLVVLTVIKECRLRSSLLVAGWTPW